MTEEVYKSADTLWGKVGQRSDCDNSHTERAPTDETQTSSSSIASCRCPRQRLDPDSDHSSNAEEEEEGMGQSRESVPATRDL